MESTLSCVSFVSILKWKCCDSILFFFKVFFFPSTGISKSVKHFKSLLCLENVLEGNPTLVRLQRQDIKSVINISVRKRKRPRVWNVILAQFWLFTSKSSYHCSSPFHPRESWWSLPSTTPSETERSHNPECSPFPFSAGHGMPGAEQGQHKKRSLSSCKRGLK